MALEIEAKFLLPDPAPLRGLLLATVGEPFVVRLEQNLFFDTADERLRRSGCGLRVRFEQDLTGRGEDKTVITYKGPRLPGEMKQREEIETEVGDTEAAANLLVALGFERKLSFEKRRSSWRVDDCRVELDEVPRLGHFAEIEGPSEEAVNRVRAKLGLKDAALEGRSYAALLDEYLQRHNIADRNVTF